MDAGLRAARCGRVTASQFHRVMGNGRSPRRYLVEGSRSDGWWICDQQTGLGKVGAKYKTRKEAEEKARAMEPPPGLSKDAMQYRDEIVAEIDSGVPVMTPQTSAMRWGVENEPAARDAAINRICEVTGRSCGTASGDFAHISHPDYPWAGVSPDFLVGSDGLGELKCPANGGNHVRAALATRDYFLKEYKWQIMGGLWVSGRQRYYVASYDPRSVSRRLGLTVIERDEEAIGELQERLVRFWGLVLERLREFRGHDF